MKYSCIYSHINKNWHIKRIQKSITYLSRRTHAVKKFNIYSESEATHIYLNTLKPTYTYTYRC